jgi:hypothetical protein
MSGRDASASCCEAIMGRLVIQAVLLLGCAGASAETRVVPAADNPRYPDQRPSAACRMEARDQGIVLRHGDGPGRCDQLGARNVWVYWSKDLETWDPKHKAVVLDLVDFVIAHKGGPER